MFSDVDPGPELLIEKFFKFFLYTSRSFELVESWEVGNILEPFDETPYFTQFDSHDFFYEMLVRHL